MASFECHFTECLGQDENSKQIKFHLDNKRQIRIGGIVDAEPQLSYDLCIKKKKNEAEVPVGWLSREKYLPHNPDDLNSILGTWRWREGENQLYTIVL